MMDDKSRFNITLPNEMIQRLENLKEEKYLPSRNAVIVFLLDEALTAKGHSRKEETK